MESLVVIPFVTAVLFLFWQIVRKPCFHICPHCYLMPEDHDDEYCNRMRRD